MDFGDGCVNIHGYLMRDGEWSKLARGTREVTDRNPDTGFPEVVRIVAADELGRSLDATGRCRNHLAVHLNPNLFTVNALTEWSFDGITAFGEDHDNWSAPAGRRFFRRELGLDER
jgi:hypothetical protein